MIVREFSLIAVATIGRSDLFDMHVMAPSLNITTYDRVAGGITTYSSIHPVARPSALIEPVVNIRVRTLSRSAASASPRAHFTASAGATATVRPSALVTQGAGGAGCAAAAVPAAA